MNRSNSRPCWLARAVHRTAPLRLGVLLTIALFQAGVCVSTVADESVLADVDNETRAKWLLDGVVVNGADGKPVPSFRVIPGSLSTNERGETKIRWRENLARQMERGVLKWPRTSGFNEMRFQIVAQGFAPMVTHRIRRGGPYTRIRVTLTPEKTPQANR